MKDNPLGNIFSVVTDILLLSFLVFFTSLFGLLVTTGASITAGLHVMFKLHDQKRRTYIFKEFMESFRKNFFQSTIAFIMICLIGVGLFFAFNFANNTGSIILLVSVYAAMIELILFVSYYFSIISVFESTSNIQTIKNTIIMIHGHIGVSIRMLGTIVLIGFMIFKVHSIFIFFGIPLYLYFNTFIIKKTFLIYIEKTRGESNEISKF